MNRCLAALLLVACQRLHTDAGGTDEGGTSSAADGATFVTSADGTSTSGTSTTGTSTSGSTGSDSSDGGGFIVIGDITGVCHCCDVWTQDCPRDSKCVPWANDGTDIWSSTKCVPLDPAPAHPGEPCTVEGGPATGLDSCDGESMCFYVDPAELMGECVAFCQGDQNDPICEGPCATCVIAYEGVISLCLQQCDPFAQSCGDGRACLPEPNGDRFVCLPAPADPATEGEPCDGEAIACAQGLACVTAQSVPDCAGEPGCCARLCDTTAMDACSLAPPGVQCTPWWAPGNEPQDGCNPPVIGACVLP